MAIQLSGCGLMNERHDLMVHQVDIENGCFYQERPLVKIATYTTDGPVLTEVYCYVSIEESLAFQANDSGMIPDSWPWDGWFSCHDANLDFILDNPC